MILNYWIPEVRYCGGIDTVGSLQVRVASLMMTACVLIQCVQSSTLQKIYTNLSNWSITPHKFVLRKTCAIYYTKRFYFNPLNAKLNPICHLLALLGAHPILHISRLRVKKMDA